MTRRVRSAPVSTAFVIPLRRQALVELVATMCFVAIGVAASSMAAQIGSSMGGLALASLVHGLAIAALVSASAHVSGGYLNPAVTIAMVATRRIALVDGIVLAAAQLAGGVLGAAWVSWSYGLIGRDQGDYVPQVAAGVSGGEAVLVEAVATAVLVWVVFAVAVDRGGAWFKVAGLPIGAAAALSMLLAGPVTGGALNPARSLGPQLVTGNLEQWWVWVAGPSLGAVVAGIAYMMAVRPIGRDGTVSGQLPS